MSGMSACIHTYHRVLSSALVFMQVHYCLFLYHAVLECECMEEEKRASTRAPSGEEIERKNGPVVESRARTGQR